MLSKCVNVYCFAVKNIRSSIYTSTILQLACHKQLLFVRALSTFYKLASLKTSLVLCSMYRRNTFHCIAPHYIFAFRRVDNVAYSCIFHKCRLWNRSVHWKFRIQFLRSWDTVQDYNVTTEEFKFQNLLQGRQRWHLQCGRSTNHCQLLAISSCHFRLSILSHFQGCLPLSLVNRQHHLKSAHLISASFVPFSEFFQQRVSPALTSRATWSWLSKTNW